MRRQMIDQYVPVHLDWEIGAPKHANRCSACCRSQTCASLRVVGPYPCQNALIVCCEHIFMISASALRAALGGVEDREGCSNQCESRSTYTITGTAVGGQQLSPISSPFGGRAQQCAAFPLPFSAAVAQTPPQPHPAVSRTRRKASQHIIHYLIKRKAERGAVTTSRLALACASC